MRYTGIVALLFQDAPHQHDAFFKDVLSSSTDFAAEVKLPNSYVQPLGRKACTLQGLKKHLQAAVELEWATIPVYLTSLYSIIDGYNVEIYNLIETVIVQEMLHMVQVANILIAINGSPLIDSPSTAPSYPVTGLPGGVLPGLRVSIERLSLEHVYMVFMAIEVPHRSFVANPPILKEMNTVSALYAEIVDCIELLGDDIFNASTVDHQVLWPWTMERATGRIIPITNVDSAIDIITSQGEGADLLDPNETHLHISSSLRRWYMSEAFGESLQRFSNTV